MINDYIEDIVRSSYRQGWDDAVKRFGAKYLAEDLRDMQERQNDQVRLIFHRLRKDIERAKQ